MKKTISLFLALVLCLTLCACGSKSSTSSDSTTPASAVAQTNPIDQTAFIGKWINICAGEDNYMDYILLSEDGTGSISFRGINMGQEIDLTWEAVDEQTISATTDSYLETITLKYNSAGELKYKDNICIQEIEYPSRKTSLINEMTANAISVDPSEFIRASRENTLKVESEYSNQFVIATGYAYNISDTSINLSSIFMSGNSIPTDSVIVYLKPDDLVTLEAGQLVTVTGVVESTGYDCQLVHAFIVAE